MQCLVQFVPMRNFGFWFEECRRGKLLVIWAINALVVLLF